MYHPIKHRTCTVMIERGPMSYGAHVPDLTGCVTVRETKEKCVR